MEAEEIDYGISHGRGLIGSAPVFLFFLGLSGVDTGPSQPCVALIW